MPHIAKRIVLHFPGFEPLDAEAHRSRYARSAMQSGQVWNYKVETGPLGGNPLAPAFTVDAAGAGWSTQSHVHILDHNGLIGALGARSPLARLAAGYRSAARVVWHGGMFGFFRHAWRFALFFLFPFLLVALGFAALSFAGTLPVLFGLSAWHLVWSLPVAWLLFFKLFLPVAERAYTLHLCDDWELAVALACLDDDAANRRLADCVIAARAALQEPADEYLISSHSMGSSVATHVIGALLQEDPEIFTGKKVVFATLGGAVLQCSLLKPASVLRSRVGAIARSANVFWLDVQCLTDVINFYRVRVVKAAGFPDLPQARILFIRFKHMLTPERYRRLKKDFLRMHRQYVLGPDRRAAFDFTLMTAGPLSARDFADFTADRLAPLAPADAGLAA
ncbi:MAG TPA: hypothetical protein VGM46_07710 [Mesorhizobium sp.]